MHSFTYCYLFSVLGGVEIGFYTADIEIAELWSG